MDGNTLQKLFSGPNPFLAQMGEQAFNQDQAKALADMRALQGREQRAQAMHPLEMLNQQATTRLNDSTARINEDKIAATPAPNVRLEQAMQKFHAESDDLTREQARADIIQRMQRAAAIKANKGAIPAWMQISPEDMKYYSGPGLDQTIALGEAFMKYDPKELGKRWDDERAQVLKQTIPGKAAGAAKDNPSNKMDNASVTSVLTKMKKASEKLAHLKVVLPQMTEEQQQQWRGTYLALKQQAEAESTLNAKVGDPDIGAVTKGSVPVVPGVNLGDAPGATTNRPARQAGSQRITIYKDGKAVGTIPSEQKEQAIKQGYIVK